MGFGKAAATYKNEKQLPLSVYDSVVKSLYSDQPTLVVGSLTMVIAPLVLHFKTGDTIQLAFASIFLLLGFVRIFSARAFDLETRHNDLSRERLEAWENRYANMGAVYVAFLGFWFLVGFAISSDPFVHLMSLALTLCYLVGVSGRNFSSERVVSQQVVAAGLPIVATFVMLGTMYHMVFAIFLLPFFASLWLISERLRNMLFHAVLASEDNRLIAERFDAALNSITHGLAMFDHMGKLVVANDRFGALIDHETCPELGSDVSSIVVDGVVFEKTDHGALVEGGRFDLAEQVHERVGAGEQDVFCFKLLNGCIVEAQFFPMSDGGVLLLEDVSDRVASEEAIRKLASFDPLTNLPNRRHFLADFARLSGPDDVSNPFSVFFLDLDKFKEINDALGHTVGDKLLLSTSARLRNLIPEDALICRFGGDEFVVVVPGMAKHEDAAQFAKQLVAEVSRPLLIDGHHINAGGCVGVAICPEHASDIDQLLKFSDAALYHAKAIGRNEVSFYTEELGDSLRDRRELETDLRRALDNGELDVYFQPLINVDSKRITTCEALVRWFHPERGMVPPSEFIPIAEEIGLITRLGEYVLRQSALECLKWPSHVDVAVNVSSIQFQQSDVCSTVRKTLVQTGLDPHRLQIEVTESAMLSDVEETTRTLKKLSAHGVKISLDDFGTGYSSLSYLRSLPLHKIKIDRSFIYNILDDERSLLLLSGITELMNKLGLSVVVEGIEQRDQMEILEKHIHMDEVQGFLFGRPLPRRDIARLLGDPELLRERLSCSMEMTARVGGISA